LQLTGSVGDREPQSNRIGKRLPSRAGSRPRRLNCAPRPVSSGCGATRAGLTKPAIFSRRSKAGSPKASTRPILKRQRRCSTNWRELEISMRRSSGRMPDTAPPRHARGLNAGYQ
jgi:hypothetical protein